MARIFIGTAVAIAGLSAAFVACQPAKDESFLNTSEIAATADQASTFENSIKAIGRLEEAVILFKDSTAVSQDTLAHQLKDALQAGNCQIEYMKNQTSDLEKVSNLKIAGADCPLLAEYQRKVMKDGNVSITAKFEILKAELIKLNDIYRMSLVGTGKATSSDTHASIQFTASGEVLSKSKGKILVGMAQSTTQSSPGGKTTASGFQRISFQFQDFEIVVKENIRIVNDVDYTSFTMNNQAILKEEYLTYSSALGIILN